MATTILRLACFLIALCTLPGCTVKYNFVTYPRFYREQVQNLETLALVGKEGRYQDGQDCIDSHVLLIDGSGFAVYTDPAKTVFQPRLRQNIPYVYLYTSDRMSETDLVQVKIPRMIDAIKDFIAERNKADTGVKPRIVIYIHGGLVALESTIEKLKLLRRILEEEPDVFPIFIGWESSLVSSWGQQTLNIRFGHDDTSLIARLLTPFVLAQQILNAAAKYPLNLTAMLREDLHTTDAEQGSRAIYRELRNDYIEFHDRPPRLVADSFPPPLELTIFSKNSECNERRFTLPYLLNKAAYFLYLPEKIALLPVISLGGTPGWDNMKRRTLMLFHQPAQFNVVNFRNQSKLIHNNLEGVSNVGALGVFFNELRKVVVREENRSRDLYSLYSTNADDIITSGIDKLAAQLSDNIMKITKEIKVHIENELKSLIESMNILKDKNIANQYYEFAENYDQKLQKIIDEIEYRHNVFVLMNKEMSPKLKDRSTSPSVNGTSIIDNTLGAVLSYAEAEWTNLINYINLVIKDENRILIEKLKRLGQELKNDEQYENLDYVLNTTIENLEKKQKSISEEITKIKLRFDKEIKETINTSIRQQIARFNTTLPNKKIEIDLVAHSMGALVINEIVRRWEDVPFENIVFMAAACSVRDLRDGVLQYLKRYQNAQFYNLVLHPRNEQLEQQLRGIWGWALNLPRGSLLIWIDNIFENANTPLDKTAGRWQNFINATPVIPTEARHRIHLKSYDFSYQPYRPEVGAPRIHGDFGRLEFWKRETWRVDNSQILGDLEQFKLNCKSFY